MPSRKIKEIFYTSKFETRFKKLPRGAQTQTIEKEKIFRENCFDSRLNTHKLKGFKNLWSFSISYSHRILFEFLNRNSVLFVDVGTHEIYK